MSSIPDVLFVGPVKLTITPCSQGLYLSCSDARWEPLVCIVNAASEASIPELTQAIERHEEWFDKAVAVLEPITIPAHALSLYRECTGIEPVGRLATLHDSEHPRSVVAVPFADLDVAVRTYRELREQYSAAMN